MNRGRAGAREGASRSTGNATARTGAGKIFIAVLLALAFLIISTRFDYLAGSLRLSGPISRAANFFSLIGNGGFLIPLSVILLGLGWYLKREGLRIVGRDSLYALLLSGALVQILKAVFERPRPSHTAGYVLHAIHHPSFFDLTGRFNSFPSGHTGAAFAMAAVLGARYPRLRLPFYTVAALIALARIGLGSHYPSDIAGGIILGLAVGRLVAKGWRWDVNKKKWLMAGLAVLVISISFFKLGGYLVFDVDEAVFSEASREMVTTGDIITPTYNFEPRYDKPILFYWAMAGAFKTMGVSEFSARFPSAGLGVLLVLVTFLFVRRFSGFRDALWASLILLLNLEFLVYSHSAVTDMTLAFFISGALFSGYGAIKTGDKRLYCAFWVSSALAMLTKGAIGLLFPLSITLIYLIIKKDFFAIKKLLNPLYILLFLVAAMPWFLVEYHARGWEWIDAFIIKHHIHRFTGVISSHGGPPYFYVLILLAGFFPWVALLPEALTKGIKSIRKAGEDNDIFSFTTIWFLFIFIFFSISRTKLPNYIFPAIPACSVMVGIIISRRIKETSHKKAALVFMAILSFILGGAALITPMLKIKMDVPLSATLFTGLGIILLLTGAFAIFTISKPHRYAPLLVAATAALLIFLRLSAVPPVNAFMQEDLFKFARYAKNAGPGAVLATFEINQPSIAFYYANGKILKLEGNSLDKITPEKKKNLLIITKASITQRLEDKYNLKTLKKGTDFALMTAKGI